MTLMTSYFPYRSTFSDPQQYNEQKERNAMTTSLLFAHKTLLLLNNSIYKLSLSTSLHTLMQNVQTKSLLIV